MSSSKLKSKINFLRNPKILGMFTLSLFNFTFLSCETSYANQSEIESNLLPFGSSAMLCMQTFDKDVIPQITKGDLMIMRVDVSHLLNDPKKISIEDLERLKHPYNYFKPHFSDSGSAKLLTQYSRMYGSKNEKMEFLYLIKAKNTGTYEFITSKTYRVITGQHELGSDELNLLQIITDFKNLLIELGQETPSFAAYMKQRIPSSSSTTETIYNEMSNGEEIKPLDERLRLAQQRIEEWRRNLSPPIYSDHQVHSNNTSFEVRESGRSGVTTSKIHQLRFNQFPKKLTVNEGDLIVVESIRPKDVITWDGGSGYPPGPYAHVFSAPEIKGVGLRWLYTETLERALLPNDHGSNHLKFYFHVESTTESASIMIGKPKISHPYTANQKDIWEKEIPIVIEPSSKEVGDTKIVFNRLPPAYLQELANLKLSDLPIVDSPLGINDVKAISEYYTEIQQNKVPSNSKEAALIEVLRPFFGEVKEQRLFFLSHSGLEKKEIELAKKQVDFNESNEKFFQRLIAVLGSEAGLARIIHHLIRLRL